MHLRVTHRTRSTLKVQKNLLEHYISLIGIPQTINIDKGRPLSEKNQRILQKHKYQTKHRIYILQWVWGKGGLETPRDYIRTNLCDGCTINEALSSSANVMRKTVHSSIKEYSFERHYGRKPKTELTNYLHLSPNLKLMYFKQNQKHCRCTHQTAMDNMIS